MQIAKNCIVSINYTLTNANEDDVTIDGSPDGEPLVYLHGAAGVIPALEAALDGKSAGDAFDVTISPADGFGDHQPDLVQTVPLASFPSADEVRIGAQFTVQEAGGEATVTVTAVEDGVVTIDRNHPLAGLTLRFAGTVADVRQATDEEVQHWPNQPPAADSVN